MHRFLLGNAGKRKNGAAQPPPCRTVEWLKRCARLAGKAEHECASFDEKTEPATSRALLSKSWSHYSNAQMACQYGEGNLTLHAGTYVLFSKD